MSIKDYIADEEKRENFLAVLQILLDKNLIEHEVEKGIAKKIIVEKTTDRLSEKQLFAFDAYVKPRFDIVCQTEDCSQKIDICHLAEAYKSDELYCVNCAMDKARLKHNANKPN
jgi:hypothetical protein